MTPPRYEKRCARFCVDAKGARRNGNQWVYVDGRTLWVCDVCARQLFPRKGAGAARIRPGRPAETSRQLMDPPQRPEIHTPTD